MQCTGIREWISKTINIERTLKFRSVSIRKIPGKINVLYHLRRKLKPSSIKKHFLDSFENNGNQKFISFVLSFFKRRYSNPLSFNIKSSFFIQQIDNIIIKWDLQINWYQLHLIVGKTWEIFGNIFWIPYFC